MSKSPDAPRPEGAETPAERSGAIGALRNPVGPKDRNVYVRRRIFVLLGLLAVVAVIALVFLKPGSSGSARDASQVEVPADLPAETAVAEDEVPACAPGQLTVLPATDKTDYAEGEQPALSIHVENVGTEACTADLGTADMVLSITSGEDEVWRSTDCQEDSSHLAVILDPGEPLVSEPVAWVRERSDPETCGIARDQVAAGGASYHLAAAAAGVTGTETAQFLLY